ncbi:unnamed protein product [Prorocentrum cordatum]|uniref:Tail specific protease domain-containing protein n=1 Tax=Prorocentrum cordatum TaxID=2364126 RepID=A0ABN9RFQ8_9DINO|nr:unnamed protein product [Polarella glacialis]
MPRVRAAPAARAALLATLVGSALASRGAGESCPSSTEDDAAGLAQVRVRQLHRQAPAPAPECELLTRPDGAGGSLSLPAAQACLDLVRGPALRAKQHMQALARYYKSFYTFALIASDPTAGNYTFDPAFADLGIFGGANGGAPADLSRVDLVGDWQKIADGIPAEGTYPIKNWVAPANAAFHKLRDCHPNIWGEDRILPVDLLNVFNLMLTDMRDEGVSIQISADQEKANINGELKPIMMERKHGSVIKSIDQQSPFRWLTENLALSSTFADNMYCIKSLGGRMNQVVDDVHAKGGGISYGLGGLGPLGGLNSGRVSVEFEGGDNASWVWRVALNYDSLLQFGCMNFACLVDKAPKLLNRSFGYGQLVELTTNSLNESWSSEALSMLFAETAPRRAAPSLPNAAPEGASLPDDVFAWIGDPSATLGYLAFRNRSDGTEFGLLKITTFLLELGERDITFELAEVMAKEWGKFVTEAQIRGVTRLLVDVVGNGGGKVTLAYDFVQMMMPELTYRQTCGSVQRPIPRAYNLWSKINKLPVEQFLSSELGSGFQADRRAALEADPDDAEAVLNNIRALLRAMESFGQPLANITSILAELAPGHVTWEAAWTGFESLVSMYKNGQCANPFFDDSQYETAYEHPQLEQRGKYTRNFTARTY